MASADSSRHSADAHPAVRYGELADRLGDLISSHDPDGTFRYASGSVTELLGYQPHELEGRWWYDLVHPDDRARVTAAHRNVLNGIRSIVSYRIQRRTGGYRWVETMSRAVHADGDRGAVTEVVCATRPLEGRSVIATVAGSDQATKLEKVQRILADEDIAPIYQPIVELATGRVVAYEGLARFPDHEFRPPNRWFADAWEVGLGAPLELLAIRAICAGLPQIPEDVRLSVNASPPTLSSPAFLECLGPEADRVTVELTEHLDIDEYEELSAALTRLYVAGCKTAIDDFGAGFASLRHLLRVGPDWIKLDISLTERVSENPVAHSLAISLLSFAESIGVQVVAEGIETAEELDAIAEIGIPLGQGFHLGMPAPLDQSLAFRTA